MWFRRSGVVALVVCLVAVMAPLAPVEAQSPTVPTAEGSPPVLDPFERTEPPVPVSEPADPQPVEIDDPPLAEGDRWPWPEGPMSSDELEAALEAKPSASEVEVVEERTEESKTFVTSTDGVYRTEFYSAPVHFQDDTGEWVDLAPDLVAGGGGLEVAGVPFEGQFGIEAAVADISVSPADDVTIGFDLGSEAPADQAAHSVEVTPIDDLNFGLTTAWPATTVEVALSPQGIKETLYLADLSAPTTFEFPLSLEGANPAITEAGHVEFTDNAGNVVGVIPRPWMEDANLDEVTREGVVSIDASWELAEAEDGRPLLRLNIDESWLHSPERVFPVRVDPTIVLGDDEAIDDTYVVPYSPADRSLFDRLEVGNNGVLTNRSYVNVDGLAQISGKVIARADLVLQQSGGACTATEVRAYRVTQTWTGSGATTWPGPSVGAMVGSIMPPAPPCGVPIDRSVRLPVTDAVEHWADGTWATQGLSIRAADEFATSMYKVFRSAQGTVSPRFEVLWSEQPVGGLSPEVPDDISPTGVTPAQAPTVSATFDDPQTTGLPDNELQGRVTYHLFLDGALQATGEGTWVDPGGVSTWAAPSLVLGKTYELHAQAVDYQGHVSGWSEPVFFTYRPLQEFQGTISQDTVWGPENGPYALTGAVTVAAGATLTILPGTSLKLTGVFDLTVRGQLLSLGSESQPISISSIRDDAAGGDSDLTRTPPSRGDWGTLKFDPAGDSAPVSVLDHTVVRHGAGGAAGSSPCGGSGRTMITASRDAVVFISNSELTDSNASVMKTDHTGVGPGRLVVSNSLLDRANHCGYWGSSSTIFVGNTFGPGLYATNPSDPTAFRNTASTGSDGVHVVAYNHFYGKVSIGGGPESLLKYNTFESTVSNTGGADPVDKTLNYWVGVTPVAYPALSDPPPTWTPALAESQAPAFGPVNAVTGELTWEESDLSVSDAGMALSWDRTYRSQQPGTGGLGSGWSTSFSESVTGTPSTGGTATSSAGVGLDFFVDPLDYGTGSGPVAQIPSAGNNAAWSGSGGTSLTMPDRTEYQFDATGQLTGVVQRDPAHVVDVDRSGGLVQQVTGVSGRFLNPEGTGTYDLVKDSQNRVVDYTVAGGRLTGVRPVGATANVVYAYGGPAGQLTSITSAGGRPTLQAGYRPDGRVQWFDTATEGRVDVAYHPEGLYTLFTRAAGTTDEVVIRVDYDDFDRGAGNRDRLVSQTTLGFRGRHVVYDGWGRVAATIDGIPEASIRPDLGATPYAPAVAATVFDDKGDATRTIDAAGQTTTTTFNTDHQPLESTYPDGSKIARVYNAEGRVELLRRLKSAAPEAWIEWKAFYDDFGQLIELCDPLTTLTLCNGMVDAPIPAAGQRAPMEYAYDPAVGGDPTVVNGDPLWTDNTAGERTTFVDLSDEGWPLIVKDPLNRQTTYEYTSWGQVKKETTPNGAVTQTAYDNDRLPTRVDAPEGKVTTYDYDGRGRLWHRVDAAGYTVPDARGFTQEATTTFAYDNVGLVKAITDGMGGTVVRNHNGAGDLEDETDPAGAITDYLYGTSGRASGLPDAVTDADHNTTSFVYDEGGRTTTVTNPTGGGAVSVTYDEMGREQERTGPRAGATWWTNYDLLGRPQRSTGPSGFDVVYNFDDVDNLLARTDEQNSTTVHTYDAADRPKTATDPIGSLWTATYDKAGQVTRRTDGTGAYTDFAYNSDGFVNRITRQTSASNTSVQYFPKIDLAGRIVEAVDPRAYAASASCRTATWASSPSVCYGTVTAYDHLDRVTQVAHPGGTNASPTTINERWFYDDNGNQRFWEDRRGKLWTYDYDAANRPVSTLDPAQGTSRQCWTPGGDPALTVDASGAATSQVYDGMHRPTSTSYGSATGSDCASMTFTGVGSPDAWTYELDGQVDVANVGGVKADNAYNTAGWLTSVTDGAGKKTTYEAFDNLGRPRLAWDPTKVSNTTTYDARGRSVDSRTWHGTSPLGCARQALGVPLGGQATTSCSSDLWRNSYDLADRLTETQWPSWNGSSGRRQVWGYDKAGRVSTAADGLGNTATYSWNEVDLQTQSLVPGGGGAFVSGFNRSGYLISETPPGLSATTWTPDGAGNPISMTEPSGRVTTYVRDNLARVTEEKVTFSGTSQSRWFGFDEAGRTEWAHGPALSTAPPPTNGPWNIDAVYDSAGRLDTVTQGGRTVDYDWDARQRLETRRFDATVVETYTYDNRGLVAAVGGLTPTTVNTRDDAGRPTRLTSGGVVEQYSYDDAGRVSNQWVTKSGVSGQLWSQTSGYNNNGDVASSVTTAGTTRTSDTVTYDAAGRIDMVSRQWDPSTTVASNELTASVDYGWNVRGDRTSAVVSGTTASGTITPSALGVPGNGTFNWTMSVAGRLTAGPSGSTYLYDADSRLTREQRPSAADTRYSYDHFGDLAKIESGDGTSFTTTANWTRDAYGRPKTITSGGATRTFSPDGLSFDPVAVTVGTATTTLTHLPSGSLLGSSNTGVGAQRAFTNNHGDLAALVPTAGTTNLSGSTVYGPFGTRSATGTNPTGLGYQTQPQDAATGIVDTPARAYDPSYGRFLQADTWDGDNSNPITLNHYTYANGSPYSMSDPTGMFSIGSLFKDMKSAAKTGYQQKQQQQRESWEGAAAAATLIQQAYDYSNVAGADEMEWKWEPGPEGDWADLNTFQQAMLSCRGTHHTLSHNAEYLREAYRDCVAINDDNPYAQQLYGQDGPRTGGGVCDSQIARIVDRGDTCETFAAVANGVDDVREGIQDTVTDPLAIPRAINTGYNEDGLYGALAAGAEVVVTPIIAAGDCLISGDTMERIRCGSAIATGVAVSLATGPVVSRLTGSGGGAATRAGGGAGDDLARAGAGGGDDATRVGRWMSPDEHAAMVDSGHVQVGSGGTTSVASPANAESYMAQARPGSHYVEFDVPTGSLRPGGAPGWSQIPSPENVMWGKLAPQRGYPMPQSPVAACNIIHVATKLPSC